jgi:hypothetical protein
MKTISELNERAWYRFIKVFYMLLLILFISLSLLIFNLSSPPKYLSKEALFKDLEAIVRVYQEPEPNILLMPFDVYEYFTGHYIEKIVDKTSIEKLGKYAKLLCPRDYEKYSNYEIGKRINDKYFTNIPYKNELYGYMVKVLLLFIKTIAVWLIIFEIIRRAFYYIVLGSLFPPK